MHAADESAAFVIAVDSQGPDATVVRVSGELDLATAPRLREVLLDPVLCPKSGVVVDLREVSFLDSAGINALVAGHRRFTKDGSMTVRCLSGPVLRALQLIGLDQVFLLAVDPGPP